MYFVNLTADISSKIGHALENEVFQKLKLQQIFLNVLLDYNIPI